MNGKVMAPKIHHSVFSISRLCVLTHTAWKLRVIYGCCAYRTTAPHSLCGLEIWLESYGGARHTLVILWFKIVYVYYKCIHTTKLIPYDCILHIKRWLYYQRWIVQEEQSWLATLHIAVSFQFNSVHYTSLKVCSQAAKKEHELWVHVNIFP